MEREFPDAWKASERDTHFLSFARVLELQRKGLVTTQRYIPSLQPDGDKPTAEMLRLNKDALKLWPKLFNASNSRAVVTCERCCKPHVVLMAEEHVSLVSALRTLVTRVEYSCGVPLDIPEDDVLHNKVRSCACLCAADTVFRVAGATTGTATTTAAASTRRQQQQKCVRAGVRFHN